MADPDVLRPEVPERVPGRVTDGDVQELRLVEPGRGDAFPELDALARDEATSDLDAAHEADVHREIGSLPRD